MIEPLRVVDNIMWQPGLRVIIRIDADVAMKGSSIGDDFRIKQALPTIKAALRHKARVRIISHRGRPHGLSTASLTQRPICLFLARLLKKKIVFVKDPFDEITFDKLDKSADILFFENIRFWKGEEENSVPLARALARWGDVYINDAFANSHRVHASMCALARRLPSYAGMNLEKEVTALERVLTSPKHPFVAMLGGAKLETKIPLIRRFLKSADHVLIGGAIANTLLAARGLNVGKSLVDEERGHAVKLLANKKLHIPSDVVVTKSLSDSSAVRSCGVDDVSLDDYIVDIGSKTIDSFSSLLAKSATVVWNGPVGFAERPAFAQGTIRLANIIRKIRAFKVIGGGDTVAALRTYDLLHGFTYVSTGGGAMLELLAGKKLLPLEILKK